MNIGFDELEPIMFDEPYVVETVEPERNFSLFKKKLNQKSDYVDETEVDEYMIHTKIRVLEDKIEREENIQIRIINLQENNLYRVGAYALCMTIFFLIILCIENYVHLSWYISIKDIYVTDLKSVGALFFWPLVLILFIGMIICVVKIILLLKRSYIVEDPHDYTYKEYDRVLKYCKKKIDEYNDEIERLRVKAYDVKNNIK